MPVALPTATIVVPTFNRPDLLPLAIESALAQTFTDFELVVADDASAADVESILRRFRDDRIVYIRRPENVGMAVNVWTALAGGRGRFVATLHDDDAWEREFLGAMVRALEAHPEVVVAFSDHWIMDGAGRLDAEATAASTRQFGRDRLTPGVVTTALEVAVCWNAVPAAIAAVFRKDAIAWAEEPREIATAYDRWLGYLATRSAPAFYDPRRLARYRVHTGQESSKLRGADEARNFRQGEAFLRRILDDPRGTRVHEWVRTSYQRVFIRTALTLAAQGLRADAQRILREGARHAAPIARGAVRCALAIPAPALTLAIAAADRLRGLR